MTKAQRIAGSFRDPSGFVFVYAGQLYRQVNRSYQSHYDQLRRSGLYDDLVARGLLIAHAEIDHLPLQDPAIYKILQPPKQEPSPAALPLPRHLPVSTGSRRH